MPVCAGFHTSSVFKLLHRLGEKLMKLLTADTHRKNRRRRKTEFCIPKNEKDQKHHSWKCNSALCWLLRSTTTVRSEHTEERRSEDEGSNCRRRLFWRFHTRLSFKCGAAETHLNLISKHRRRAQVKDAPSFLSPNTKRLM